MLSWGFQANIGSIQTWNLKAGFIMSTIKTILFKCIHSSELWKFTKGYRNICEASESYLSFINDGTFLVYFTRNLIEELFLCRIVPRRSKLKCYQTVVALREVYESLIMRDLNLATFWKFFSFQSAICQLPDSS